MDRESTAVTSVGARSGRNHAAGERRSAARLRVRLRSFEPDHRRRPRRRRRCRPGLRTPARRDHQGAPGQAGGDRRGRQPPRAGLRQRSVHAADDAGRGLPDPARDAGDRRHHRRPDLRLGGRTGRDRRRPGRDPAADDRRPDGDRRRDPGAPRDRPVPAGAARDQLAPARSAGAPPGDRPGEDALRHGQDARLRRRRGHPGDRRGAVPARA